jgi:hypothetical protein
MLSKVYSSAETYAGTTFSGSGDTTTSNSTSPKFPLVPSTVNSNTYRAGVSFSWSNIQEPRASSSTSTEDIDRVFSAFLVLTLQKRPSELRGKNPSIVTIEFVSSQISGFIAHRAGEETN